MIQVSGTLNGMAKKQPAGGKKSNTGPTPPEEEWAQFNVRLERRLVEEFDRRRSRVLPEPSQASVVRMLLQAFIIDPDAFLGLVKDFIVERSAGNE
jgi:hypothetical protein